MAITSYGDSFQEALAQSYKNVAEISWENVYFRKDIGFDLV